MDKNPQAEAVLDRLFTEWKAADSSLDFDREYDDDSGDYLITATVKDGERTGYAKTKLATPLLAGASDGVLAYLTKQVFKSIADLRKPIAC